MSGTLYIVATPIGNLGDVTYRAIDTLKAVGRVVAEDTRVTKRLLDRYGIKKPLTSLRARSLRDAFERVADMVGSGESVAYVTDAGTPGISDPGNLLVAIVRERYGEKSVIPIPGPSALVTAISVAGIQTDEFVFLGFLPHKKGRKTALDEIAEIERVVVLYESPHRIVKLFEELSERMPLRHAVVCREMTKIYESVVSGDVTSLTEKLKSGVIPARGEFVVILAPATL